MPSDPDMSALRIVVAGYLVRCPLGGYAWQVAHYLLGLRRLGHDVWFYEDNAYYAPAFDPQRQALEPQYDYGIDAAARFFARLGFAERWVFVDATGNRAFGATPTQIARLFADADLVINLGGVNRIDPERRGGRRSLYVDLDPAYTQLRLANGDRKLRALLDEHAVLCTTGENIGSERSPIPTGDLVWHPTRQPIVIDQWSDAGEPGAMYTTVGKWNFEGRDIELDGETFHWRKRSEFLRCIGLPQRTGVSFELAMDVDSVEGDADQMRAHGWRIADPLVVSSDPWTYRDYIQHSRGEFTVAKDMNVRLRSGWFSDRAACYLAAGRPVIEQDTAFGDVLPLGAGLRAFRTVEEAAEAINAVEADYADASAYASEVAREYFAAEKVLSALLAVAGA